jgi:hypothetical protein
MRLEKFGELGTKLQYLVTLLVTLKVVSSAPILVIIMMEAVCSSETSVLTRATLHHVPDDSIIQSHRRENPELLRPGY